MEGIQKKIAVLNDLSGYGRCSLTAAMPVISALKVQCCPVVTAVLSNHAGYPECYMDDYTDRMEAYLEPWRKMGFAGSSHRQVRIRNHSIHIFGYKTEYVNIIPILFSSYSSSTLAR